MPSLEPPWWVGMAPSATTSSAALYPNTTANSDHKEDKEREKHMKSLVAALRRCKDDLPEELQSLVKEVTIRSGQEETKFLHSAVSQHGRAKKELQEAQTARLAMHAAWKNFLAQSVDQWSKYTEQFMQQERQMMDRLKAAQENLTAAKENLGACKASAGLENKEDAAMLSDAEDPDPRVAETSAGQKIAASFQDLASSLQTLHKQAEQAVQLEEEQNQLRKRPRMNAPDQIATSNAEDGKSPSFGAPE